MRMLRLLVCLLFPAIGVACGGSSNPSSPGGSDGGTIVGTERIGWNQRASGAAELATFDYFIYVDGVRHLAPEHDCATSPGPDGFACSSKLPPMSAGPHILEVSTYARRTDAESSRSAPLRVTVQAIAPPAPDTQQKPSSMATSDGVALARADVLDGLDDPSDFAFAPDSRLFIAERRGRVRIGAAEALAVDPALVLDDAVVVNGAGGLLALALDPDFARTRLVYLLHVAASDAGPVFRLSRYREAGGVLGERAVLLDRQPASSSQPSGALRFGIDGKLYVLFDDGGDREAASRTATFNGKLLRLNADGTTPADAPSSSPVVATGFVRPGGLDWQPGSLRAWIVDRLGPRSRLESWRAGRREADAFGLPQGTGGALTFYRGLIAELEGNLLIASPERRELARVRFDPADGSRVAGVETLLHDVEVRAVAAGPDGRVYVATRSEIWAFGR